MAGVTDYAYRTIAAEMGADVTVTEMVSSRALCYDDKKTVKLLAQDPNGCLRRTDFRQRSRIYGEGCETDPGTVGL